MSQVKNKVLFWPKNQACVQLFVITGGGKSRCDTYAAITKHKVDAHVRSGGCADTPREFAKAIVATRSVANVTCMLGTIKGELPSPKLTIPKIKQLHQFMYCDGAIVARRIPGVGEGILLDMTSKTTDVTAEFVYELMNEEDMENFRPRRRTSKPFASSSPTLEPAYNFEEQKTEAVECTQSSTLYRCEKNLHCTLKFTRPINFHKHMNTENSCKIQIIHPNHRDLMITMNVKDNGLPNNKNLLETDAGKLMLLSLQKAPLITVDENLPMESTELSNKDHSNLEHFPIGHGLPLPKKVTRHSPDVHLFVWEVFKFGLQPGNTNVKSSAAVKMMEEARNPDGSLRFPDISTRLDERQVLCV